MTISEFAFAYASEPLLLCMAVGRIARGRCQYGHCVPSSKGIVKLYYIDCNCNMLPLILDDLLNYTTLMLKFCTNKPIWASLLRQVLFWRGERGHFAKKKGVTLHPRATDFQEKKAVFFGGGKGAFCPKKGCNAPSAGYRLPRKKNPPQAQNVL